MARETIYVVQAYRREESGILHPETPIACKTQGQAKERALRMKDRWAAVVAFARTGDVDLGEYDDAVIIAKYGEVPADDLPD